VISMRRLRRPAGSRGVACGVGALAARGVVASGARAAARRAGPWPWTHAACALRATRAAGDWPRALVPRQASRVGAGGLADGPARTLLPVACGCRLQQDGAAVSRAGTLLACVACEPRGCRCSVHAAAVPQHAFCCRRHAAKE
jgi:hypothetical protein